MASTEKVYSNSDSSRLSDHDGHADDRQHAAANHVHDVLGLACAAINSIRDVCANGGCSAGNGVLTIEPLNEEEDAKSDEDDADNVFHG